jgi:exopolysaccharide biosynthesis polyprenyl glycosylphosphotransferase
MFVAADLAAIWSGALLALALRFSFHVLHDPLGYPSTITGHLAFLLLYSGLIVLFSNTQRLYSDYQHPCTRLEVYAVTRSVAMASVLLAVCIYVSGIHFISRLIIAITMFHAIFAMSGWRYMRRRRIKAAVADGLICHNVVIVGTNRTAQAVKRHLNESAYLGFVVRGLLTGDVQDDTDQSALGSINDLVAVCRTQFIDEVIVCAQSRETVNRVVADGRRLGFGVRLVPDMYDGNLWETKLEYLGELGSFTVHDRKLPVLQLKLKRAIDVVCSGFGLIVLSPVLALLAALVKLNSRGPVFYVSDRVGRKGRIFRCYKFRTMVSNAEQLKEKLKHLNERDGILFKIANDPRITKVGQYLRKYSLDELPQLWNVLKGDMSIVGPRPPIASEVERYELEYLRRLDAAPGITGLWQVQARRNPSFDRYIALDLEYVEQWSLALDLRILLKTIGVVFAGTGQ